MFSIFKKKSEVEVLDQLHKKALKQAFTLSKSNRSESDKKYAEADAILKKIEAINSK